MSNKKCEMSELKIKARVVECEAQVKGLKSPQEHVRSEK